MKKTLILFFTLWVGVIYSQNTLSPSGKSISGKSISVDYTIGQIAVTSIGNNKYTLHQGFHQTIKIERDTTNDNIPLDVSVWPNPVTSVLNIKTQSSGISYALYNSLQQQTFFDGFVSGNTTKLIDISKLPAATYLLVLTYEQYNTNVFKILKIN